MARVAITAAMIRMVFRFSPATPMSIILARAVGSSMAVTAESSISALTGGKEEAPGFPETSQRIQLCCGSFCIR